MGEISNGPWRSRTLFSAGPEVNTSSETRVSELQMGMSLVLVTNFFGVEMQ